MQNKDSFVLYTKYIDIFKELTDEQRQKLTFAYQKMRKG